MKYIEICLHNFATRVYRACVFPFRKLSLLVGKKVVFGIDGYADMLTSFSGDNYVGQRAFLSKCSLGRGTYVGDNSYICNLEAGKFCSIGFNTCTAIGKHPIRDNISTSPSVFSTNPANNLTFTQKQLFDENTGNVKLGNDVWIGNNVVLLGGVSVGDGAIIGAGSVVTKSLEPYGIYAGSPAKRIGNRFDEEQINVLEGLKWWDKDDEWIRSHVDDFANPEGFFESIKE